MSNTRTKTIIASSLLILCIIIFFHKVVFSGRALSGTDILFVNPPFSNAAPPGFNQPSNWALWDQANQFYPFLHFARENIRRGHLPLWDPYIRMGVPFLADAQSAEIYPINTVFYIFPFKDAFAIDAFIKLFLAGLGMYLFISALGIAFAGSMFSAITFMFCAFNVVWLAWPQTNVSVFLPWLFFFLYKYIQTDRLKYIGWLALITGIQFLGGHPETSAHVLLSVAMYALFLLFFRYRDAQARKKVKVEAGYVLAAVLLGFLIASPLLLPFLSELLKSATWTFRSGTDHFFLPLSALPLLLMPGFYGSPVTLNFWGPAYPNEEALYVGVIAIMLALIAIVVRRKDRHVILFACMAAFFLLVAFGVPPFYQIVTMLPGFSHMKDQRLILLYQFCMAALAGFGIDVIDTFKKYWPQNRKAGATVEGNIVDTKYLRRAVTQSGMFIIIVALISIAVAYSQKDLTGHGHVLAIETMKILCFTAVGFILTNLAINTRRRKGYLLGMLVISQFFALYVTGHNFNPQIRKDLIYPKAPPDIALMQKDTSQFRFAAFGLTFLPNTLMVYHVSDIRGYEYPMGARYNTFFRRILGIKLSHGHGGYLFRSFDPAIYNPVNFKKYLELMNVKYIYYPAKTRAGRGVMIRYQDYKPRAYLAHEVITAYSPDEAVQLIKTHIDALLNDSVVIESNKEIEMPACPAEGGDYVTIDTYQPDMVKLTVFNACKAVLVLSDTYDDGWQVKVDRKRGTILHADYLFRGVILGPGMHTVQFDYAPLSFRLGVIFSALGLLASTIVIFF